MGRHLRMERLGELRPFAERDGNLVMLRLLGNPGVAVLENSQGYTVVNDAETGRYCYARQNIQSGALESSGIPCTEGPTSLPSGVGPHIRPAASEYVLKTKLAREMNRTIGPDDGLLEGPKRTIGSVIGVTLLIEFDDVRFDANIKSEVDELMNGNNYRKYSNFCSVREYFKIMSTGKLDYSNSIVGPVRVPWKKEYYETHPLVPSAMKLLSEKVNFHDLMTDADMVVPAVNLVYAGESRYIEHPNSDLWPHNHVYKIYQGNMRTHFYQITGIFREDSRHLSIGTLCHENGHMICRFPDLYDYGSRDGDRKKSQGIGRWCLMGSGSHNDEGRTPAPVSPYLRELVGWATTVDLNDIKGQFELEYGKFDTVYRWKHTRNDKEYFLLEPIFFRGLHMHMPDDGLAIFHCDKNGSNEWQDGTSSRHYQNALLQADNRNDLENNSNRGDKHDLFDEGDRVGETTEPNTLWWNGTSDPPVPEISVLNRTPTSIWISVGDSGLGEPEEVTFESRDTPIYIPDNNPQGVSSTIFVDPIRVAAGIVQSVTVSVDFTHEYEQDVSLTLLGPGRRSVEIYRGSVPGKVHEIVNKTLETEFSGALVSGSNWSLLARDSYAYDTGIVNHWTITIEIRKATKEVKSGTVFLKDSSILHVDEGDDAGKKFVCIESPQHPRTSQSIRALNLGQHGRRVDVEYEYESGNALYGASILESASSRIEGHGSSSSVEHSQKHKKRKK